MEGGNGRWDPFPIELVASKERGRHFVATKNLKKGDIIIRVHPIASVLNDSELLHYCSGCFSPAETGEICSICKKVKFCKHCYKVTDLETP